VDVNLILKASGIQVFYSSITQPHTAYNTARQSPLVNSRVHVARPKIRASLIITHILTCFAITFRAFSLLTDATAALFRYSGVCSSTYSAGVVRHVLNIGELIATPRSITDCSNPCHARRHQRCMWCCLRGAQLRHGAASFFRLVAIPCI
jgi:hypothetical protein